jgi:hypothetical protein
MDYNAQIANYMILNNLKEGFINCNITYVYIPILYPCPGVQVSCLRMTPSRYQSMDIIQLYIQYVPSGRSLLFLMLWRTSRSGAAIIICGPVIMCGDGQWCGWTWGVQDVGCGRVGGGI